MTIEFTKHPALEAPTDEEIVILGEADPKLLVALHEAHEGRIQFVTDLSYQAGAGCAMPYRTTMRSLPLGGTEAGRQRDVLRWSWNP